MGTRSAAAAVASWTVLAVVYFQLACAERREVFGCGELRWALNDTGVDHVVVMPAEDWNCTQENFPPYSVYIQNRSVVYEAGAPGIRMDMNQVPNQIIIGEGGFFIQRNLWGDDCYMKKFPYSCMTKLEQGGRMNLTGMTVSDAMCVNVKDSISISTSMMFFRLTGLLTGQHSVKVLDERTVHLSDTGWVQTPDVKAHMRLFNVTLTCTGNITHPVPPDTRLIVLPVWQQMLLAAAGALLVILMLGLLWCWRKRARESDLAEHRIAESRGFLLEAPLGSGHFGRVYRGRNKATGQPVAVKIIDLLPSQRRQLAYACRECQLMAGIQHESIVRVYTFYAAQVQQQQRVVEPNPGVQYVDLGFNVASIVDGTAAAAWAEFESAAQQPLPPKSGIGNSGGRADTAFTLSPGVAASGSAATTTSDGMDGLLFTQVQLVMQFCDMGTLNQAVKAGMFRDPQTGRPKLHHVLATARDVAAGLAHLHSPPRRMVHRDLSANNVLLATSTADERGFRALLSDFGLSTSLSNEATHKTSEVKGTLSYMSPELFIRDDVSPALDVYSLGILMHLMLSGADPYASQAAAQIILDKVRATEQPDKPPLPALADCPEALQQLVWDCTHPHRHSRPDASRVLQRLEGLLAATS